VQLVDTAGPGVTGVELDVGGTQVSLTRTDGRTAVVRRPGQPDRSLPLLRRELSDLLTEELRRLDADDTYREALEAATQTTGLAARPALREHEWRDPAQAPA